MIRRILAPLAVATLAGLGSAQQVGSRLPAVNLSGFSQTGAQSFEDFYGRAVLLEFFAYW